MKKASIYFTKVAPAAGAGSAVLAGHMVDEEDEPTFTRFFLSKLDNSWGLIGDMKGDIAYDLATTDSIKAPGKTDMYALGREGTLRIRTPPGSVVDHAIPLKANSVYMEGLCVAENATYVCGGQRQIYRFSNGTWADWSDSLYLPFAGSVGPTLFAVTEVEQGCLLTVGSGGFVAMRRGTGPWIVLNSPTNQELHAVLRDGSGGAWIGGDGGTLLHLRLSDQQWTDLSDTSLSAESFERMAFYKGEIYIAAFDSVLTLSNGNRLRKVKGPFKADSEFHCVCAAGEYLWVTGDEHVYRLGPSGWDHLLCPDNA